MGSVYTAEQLAKYEFKEESYADDKFPNALQLRNARAKALRKEGWYVVVGTTDFTDLARCKVCWLQAIRRRDGTEGEG